MNKKILISLIALLGVCLIVVGVIVINNLDLNTEKSDKNDDVPTLYVGDSAATRNSEFKIEYVDITKDVRPIASASFYSHYEAPSGKVYLDICLSYKNTDKSKVTVSDIIDGSLLYNGKSYDGFSIIEEGNRSDFYNGEYEEIEPLSKEYIHYLFEIPKSAQTDSKKITLSMKIGGKKFDIVARKEGEKIEGVTASATKIQKNQSITTSNAEFYIESTSIAKIIKPPFPASYYSYYEADDGKKYVEISFSYKNTSTSSVDADSVISATLIYNAEYKYYGFTTIEENNRSDFTYTNITNVAALETAYIHYLFEVPDEVASSNSSLEIVFTIDGNTYNYKIR